MVFRAQPPPRRHLASPDWAPSHLAAVSRPRSHSRVTTWPPQATASARPTAARIWPAGPGTRRRSLPLALDPIWIEGGVLPSADASPAPPRASTSRRRPPEQPSDPEAAAMVPQAARRRALTLPPAGSGQIRSTAPRSLPSPRLSSRHRPELCRHRRQVPGRGEAGGGRPSVAPPRRVARLRSRVGLLPHRSTRPVAQIHPRVWASTTQGPVCPGLPPARMGQRSPRPSSPSNSLGPSPCEIQKHLVCEDSFDYVGSSSSWTRSSSKRDLRKDDPFPWIPLLSLPC